jgi:hypothetical protein
MIVREIVRTCSNRGDFAQRFSRDAEKRNLNSGLFAAGLVRRFSRQAGASEWEGVSEATRGADQPILSGLKYILERGVELEDDDANPRWAWCASAPLSSRCGAWPA